MAADDFFVGYFETAMEPDEMLTAVRIPRRPGEPWGYQKFTRRANDWAIVGVAAVAGRVALANMGARRCGPRRPRRPWPPGLRVTEAAALAAEGTEPGEDIHADREYRQHLARVLTERALQHQTG